jgi:hypothetical protein
VNQATDVVRRPIYRAEKPVRNALYKRWIKRFACIFCGSTRLVDPMHTGEHGHGSKSSDLQCIPGCRECHELFDANPRGFARDRGIDVAAEIRKFNNLWQQKQEGSAA